MINVITTFSKDGYELYGNRMIDSWLKFWPSNYTLTVYTEGYTLSQTHSRLKTLDINEKCPNLKLFKDNSERLLTTSDKKYNNKIKKTIKWCHKVYAMAHAIKNNSGYLIFLDGDTETLGKVNPAFAETLVGNNLFAVHFEKLKGKLHFETGLVVFNLSHHFSNWLANELTNAYDSLKIYNLHKTWDGYLFADLYQQHKLPVKNLGEGTSGVFSHPEVRRCLKHYVGPKKYEGKGFDRYTGKKK